MQGQWIRGVVTFYCNEGPHGCKICNGKWAFLNRTASGTIPKVGRTVAAPRSIPFGTYIYIDGFGWRIAEDRTADWVNGRFDVFVATHREAKELGIRHVWVWIEQARPR